MPPVVIYALFVLTIGLAICAVTFLAEYRRRRRHQADRADEDQAMSIANAHRGAPLTNRERALWNELMADYERSE